MTDWAAQITKLEAALGSGVLTVESDGERVTYRSIDDLRKALDYAKGQQSAAAAGATSRPASTVAVYCPD